jgi:hypothetical protein
MAPVMVCLMLAIHECAPRHAKPFTRAALGWMLAAAAFTIVVHFVQLTVARHMSSATFPGYASIFGWKWPSAFYAIDIVAWDVFFGLALLFAVPAFADRADAWVRRGLILSGSMCLIGLVGPSANMLGAAHDRHRRLHDRLRPDVPPAQPLVPGNARSYFGIPRRAVETARITPQASDRARPGLGQCSGMAPDDHRRRATASMAARATPAMANSGKANVELTLISQSTNVSSPCSSFGP